MLGKDKDRPINSLADRLAVLAALSFVDFAIGFGEETPLELIRLCRPDWLIKGGDWPVSEIIGADLVQVSGGTVHTIPIRYPCSTSKLLEKIRTAKN